MANYDLQAKKVPPFVFRNKVYRSTVTLMYLHDICDYATKILYPPKPEIHTIWGLTEEFACIL